MAFGVSAEVLTAGIEASTPHVSVSLGLGLAFFGHSRLLSRTRRLPRPAGQILLQLP